MRFALPVLIALTCALLTPAPAQQPGVIAGETGRGPAISVTPPTASITGTVFCADNHRPARGAMVMVTAVPSDDPKHPASNSSTGMTRVALDGTYTIHKLEPGEYSVVALYPGYLSPLGEFGASDFGPNDATAQAKQREILRRYGTVSVAANASATFDVTLQRGATVSGQVLYSDGAPASQVTIDVEDINAKPASSKSPMGDVNGAAIERTLFTHQSIGTDDQGNFRISGINPGTYRVIAAQPAPPPSDPLEAFGAVFVGLTGLAKDPNALRVYAGDTLHKNAAKTYELRAGDDVPGISITIPVNAFHRITGTLTAKDGRTLNSATLTLTDTTDDSFKFTTTLTSEGTFTFATVPAGTYTLSAVKGKILVPATNAPKGVPLELAPKHTANAFADGSTSIIVKDADLDDVSLTLAEVPVPPNADKDNNPFAIMDDTPTPDPPSSPPSPPK